MPVRGTCASGEIVEREYQWDGGAVRDGDDSAVLRECRCVHLGHDQRDVLVESPGARLVDRDAAAAGHFGGQFAGERARRREENEVRPLERIRPGLCDDDAFAAAVEAREAQANNNN